MKFTNISQVRHHLYRMNPGEQTIRNHRLRLTSVSEVSLPHSHLVRDTEKVKAMEISIPISETLTLAGATVSLAHDTLALGTVVCAADSSLSVIYQENIDFSIDYEEGSIIRIDSGSIPSGTAVTVWYLYYRVYVKGVDYSIDSDRGRIRRLASGAIEDGQELLLDYSLGSSEFSDTEIDQCIAEGEAELVTLIKPEYLDSDDPALQTAATWLTLAILCRNSAGMAQAGDITGVRQGNSWMELSQSYRMTAMKLITWFRRESPQMNPPHLT